MTETAPGAVSCSRTDLVEHVDAILWERDAGGWWDRAGT